jgi:hypothetical protein
MVQKIMKPIVNPNIVTIVNTKIDLRKLPSNLAELLFISAELDVKTLQMHLNHHHDSYESGHHVNNGGNHYHRNDGYEHSDVNTPHEDYYRRSSHWDVHENCNGY